VNKSPRTRKKQEKYVNKKKKKNKNKNVEKIVTL
jgi:hypothetical protein